MHLQLHCAVKEVPTIELCVTVSSLERFSKFLHTDCYETNTTIPTSPETCYYTIVRNNRREFSVTYSVDLGNMQTNWDIFGVQNV